MCGGFLLNISGWCCPFLCAFGALVFVSPLFFSSVESGLLERSSSQGSQADDQTSAIDKEISKLVGLRKGE